MLRIASQYYIEKQGKGDASLHYEVLRNELFEAFNASELKLKRKSEAKKQQIQIIQCNNHKIIYKHRRRSRRHSLQTIQMETRLVWSLSLQLDLLNVGESIPQQVQETLQLEIRFFFLKITTSLKSSGIKMM